MVDETHRQVETGDTVRSALPEGESWLTDVPLRQHVELVRIDLPREQMEPLLERGVLPGCRLCPLRRSPFGDPILEIDGLVIAVRRETAECLCVRNAATDAA